MVSHDVITSLHKYNSGSITMQVTIRFIHAHQHSNILPLLNLLTNGSHLFGSIGKTLVYDFLTILYSLVESSYLQSLAIVTSLLLTLRSNRNTGPNRYSIRILATPQTSFPVELIIHCLL